jgi:hypothetical protein
MAIYTLIFYQAQKKNSVQAIKDATPVGEHAMKIKDFSGNASFLTVRE